MNPLSQTKQALQSEIDIIRKQLLEMKLRCESAEIALHDLDNRNRLIGNSAPFGIFTIDITGSIKRLNRKMREMFAWTADEKNLPVNIFEYHPMIEAGIVRDFQNCVENKKTITKNHPCVNIDGNCLQLKYTLSPIIDDNGIVTGVLAFVEDITNLKMAEMAIRESEDRYRMLFQSAPVALIERNASQLKIHLETLRNSGVKDFHAYLNNHPEAIAECMGMIKTVDYNEAFLRLMEARDREELESGSPWIDPKDYKRTAKELILMCADGNITREREETIGTVKGNRKNVIIKSLLVSGHEETYARIVVSLVDITLRKQAEKALHESEQNFREQAMRDILTGLYNRRYLYHSLEELISDSRQTKACLSLIFMDLDNFKLVVDTHGHLNGSRAIQEVAATIAEFLEKPAYAVAYAGDEFVLVLPGYGKSQAEEKALQIRSRINTTTYLQDIGISLNLTASFGMATFPDHATDMTSLLAVADKALFAVKAKSKNAIGWAETLKP